MTPAASVAADKPRTHAGQGLLSPHAALALTAALLLPLGLHLVGLSSLNRLLYPAAALATGAYLYSKRSPWYLGFCVWLFAASPLVRRLADYQAGFEVSSLVLLAPYLACLFAWRSCAAYVLRPSSKGAAPFVALLACVGYGLGLAVLDGRTVSGVVDALKWSVGPVMAVHLLAEARQREAMHRVLACAFVSAGIAMSAYGVAQFVAPAPWDAEWLANMIQQGLTSAGLPEPFQIRVFSTMHSPGSFGAFLTIVVVLLLGTPSALMLPGVGLVAAGLALCQYRAVWAGTALAVACVLVFGSARSRLRILLSAAAMALAFAGLATVPEISDALGNRARSLTEINADASGEDRLQQYQRVLDEGENLLLGSGLAVNGAARRMDGQNAVVIDSGLLEAFTALGVVGSAVFLGSLVAVAARAMSVPRRCCPEIHLYRAGILGWLVQLPFGSVYLGELGFGPWLLVGLALAASLPNGAEHNR